MTRIQSALIVVSTLWFFQVGCSSTNGAGSGANGGSDGGGGGSAKAAPSLTCLAVLTCVNQNNCSDDACVNACMAKGSSEAQNDVTTLATCYQKNSCQDAACIKASCATELNACVAESGPQPTGTPSDGTNLPQGKIPANLVGSWNYVDGFDPSSEVSWQFNADGTASYRNAHNGGIGGCDNTSLLGYDGVAVFDDTTFTFYAKTASSTTSVCGAQTNAPAQIVTTTYDWHLNDDGTLRTTEQKCEAEYAGYQTSIDLYCGASLTRQ